MVSQGTRGSQGGNHELGVPIPPTTDRSPLTKIIEFTPGNLEVMLNVLRLLSIPPKS